MSGAGTYTEDEAKYKWCPFVRIHEQPSVTGKGPRMYAYNRPDALGSMTCVGSSCMAWRESRSAMHQDNCASLQSDDLECDCMIAPAYGYCGLAGPTR